MRLALPGVVLHLLRQAGVFGAAVLLMGAAAPPGPPGVEFRWRPVVEGVHGEPVSALAVGYDAGPAARGSQLAVGDSRGVRVQEPSGGFSRLLNRGPVVDLAFLPPDMSSGSLLLAATANGLYRVTQAGSQIVRPGPGAEARAVHRVGVVASAVAVASDAGAFLSSDTIRWQRLSARLPLGPATALAMRETASGLEIYTIVDGRVWRVPLQTSAAGWHELGTARESFGFSVSSQKPVDVVFDVAGEDVVVVLQSAFAARSAGEQSWRRVEPALPPGVQAHRLHAAHGRLWLATDRGLLAASRLQGPWQRTPGPAGTAEVRSVASDRSTVYVAAGERVLAADLGTGRGTAAAACGPQGCASALAAGANLALRTPEGDPPIEQVHRAALAYLRLERRQIDSLRRGVARRGWLPLMSLRAARAHDDDRSTDFDEIFSSGELRSLVDRERRSARDFEASLTFTWDLGDVAYHPEEIDVSREGREVIKLRDDVLDEVTQLYFERRRVMAELYALPDAPPGEKLRLRLRAAELAAGIDAWTGGWFARARAGGGP